MARAPWSFLTVVLSFSCAGMFAEPAPQRDESLHDSSGAAVIATLHTRDSELKITSSGGEVRYSLVDAQGIEKSMSLEELQSYDRNLYEFVKSATARRGPVLDARVGPSTVPWGADGPARAEPGSTHADRDRTSVIQRALTPAR